MYAEEIRINALFIYAKEKEVKVLTHSEACEEHKNLIKEGWAHTTTMNPYLFINNLLLLNNEEIIKEINILKGVEE